MVIHPHPKALEILPTFVVVCKQLLQKRKKPRWMKLSSWYVFPCGPGVGLTDVRPQVKSRDELDMYIFELNSEFMDPHAITLFDQLDMVFMDGLPNEPPWSPRLRKVCILSKMCFLAKKCVFGFGFMATMLAYLCSTGGELIRVLNKKSKTSRELTVSEFTPPSGTPRTVPS